jgi:hypothetical protein
MDMLAITSGSQAPETLEGVFEVRACRLSLMLPSRVRDRLAQQDLELATDFSESAAWLQQSPYGVPDELRG